VTQCGPRFFRQCMTMADCEPKREKSADCIPRDQLVGDPIENNKQQAGENCKHDDAAGVDQAAAVTEDMRQVIVLRDGRQSGENRRRQRKGTRRELMGW
jgi:hypothetical protein